MKIQQVHGMNKATNHFGLVYIQLQALMFAFAAFVAVAFVTVAV